jgi:hypothetical protein
MDYFKEDGEALSADIIQKMIECYEFKFDSNVILDWCSSCPSSHWMLILHIGIMGMEVGS